MVVRVRYVFGLACGAEGGRDEVRLELPGGATVFEAMQELGVAALEIHAAVNGQSAADATVLCDGDEMTLIPAIQGGVEEMP
jgi:sulfur carrier protein ThiS